MDIRLPKMPMKKPATAQMSAIGASTSVNGTTVRTFRFVPRMASRMTS